MNKRIRIFSKQILTLTLTLLMVLLMAENDFPDVSFDRGYAYAQAGLGYAVLSDQEKEDHWTTAEDYFGKATDALWDWYDTAHPHCMDRRTPRVWSGWRVD